MQILRIDAVFGIAGDTVASVSLLSGINTTVLVLAGGFQRRYAHPVMREDIMNENTLCLDRGISLFWRCKRGILFCVSGRLWITCKGDGRDFLLERGQSLDLRGRSGICLQSLETAEFCIRTASPSVSPAGGGSMTMAAVVRR
jgi:hypothetical protein